MKRRIGLGIAALMVQEGPAFLAWGGWRGFAGHPARLASAAVSALAALTAAATGVNFSRGQRELARQRLAAVLMFGSILGGKGAAAFSDRRGLLVIPGEPIRWVGLAASVAGAIAFELSRRALGRHYSVMAAIQKDHQLITDGPYRLARHPGYASLLLYHAGYTLIHRSLLGLATTIPLAFAILWRVRDEEALLRSEFGETYDDYCRRTARLIPGIY